MATVNVACNIPGGLVLGLAAAPNGSFTVPVVLAGPPASAGTRTSPGYGMTAVDATFWTNWVAASQTPEQAATDAVYYGNPAALTSGAVLEM